MKEVPQSKHSGEGVETEHKQDEYVLDQELMHQYRHFIERLPKNVLIKKKRQQSDLDQKKIDFLHFYQDKGFRIQTISDLLVVFIIAFFSFLLGIGIIQIAVEDLIVMFESDFQESLSATYQLLPSKFQFIFYGLNVLAVFGYSIVFISPLVLLLNRWLRGQKSYEYLYTKLKTRSTTLSNYVEMKDNSIILKRIDGNWDLKKIVAPFIGNLDFALIFVISTLLLYPIDILSNFFSGVPLSEALRLLLDVLFPPEFWLPEVFFTSVMAFFLPLFISFYFIYFIVMRIRLYIQFRRRCIQYYEEYVEGLTYQNSQKQENGTSGEEQILLQLKLLNARQILQNVRAMDKLPFSVIMKLALLSPIFSIVFSILLG